MEDFLPILRNILSQKPTAEGWQELLWIFSQISPEHHSVLVSYLQQHIHSWPDSLRTLPLHWFYAEDEPWEKLFPLLKVLPIYDDSLPDFIKQTKGQSSYHFVEALLICKKFNNSFDTLLSGVAEWNHAGGDFVLQNSITKEQYVLLSGNDYHGEVEDVCIAPNQKHIVAFINEGFEQGRVCVWERSSKQLTWEKSYTLNQDSSINEPFYSIFAHSAREDQLLCFNDSTGDIELLEICTGHCIETTQVGGQVLLFTLSSCERYMFLIRRPNQLELWDFRNKKLLHTKQLEGADPRCLLHLPQTNEIVVVSSEANHHFFFLEHFSFLDFEQLQPSQPPLRFTSGPSWSASDIAIAKTKEGYRLAWHVEDTVHIQDFPSHKRLTLPYATEEYVVMSFSDQGQQLLFGDYTNVFLWSEDGFSQ